MDDFIETKVYILKSAEDKRNPKAKTSADIETNSTMKDDPDPMTDGYLSIVD